jgi:hypothetical protein
VELVICAQFSILINTFARHLTACSIDVSGLCPWTYQLDIFQEHVNLDIIVSMCDLAGYNVPLWTEL